MRRSGTRLGRLRRLGLMFAGLFVVLVLVGVVVGAAAPPSEAPRCTDDNPCGEPPSLAKPLANQERWAAKTTGVTLEYDAAQWKVDVDENDTLQLTSRLAGLVLLVQTERSRDDAKALLEARRTDLAGRTLGLERDHDDANRILGPAVGHVDGAGEAYVGGLDTPQGVQNGLNFVLLASTQRGVGIKVTVLTDEHDADRRKGVYQLADAVLNTVAWS